MALVVGTDLSEQSLQAVSAAVAIAARRGDRELHLVHVLDDAGLEDADEAALGRAVAEARERLDADAARLAAGTGLAVRADVLIGQADEALVAIAETEAADLLIVTSRGHSGSSLRKLGGVSEKIAVRSTRPVLVVRDAAPLVAWARGERSLRVLAAVDDSAACEGAVALVRTLRTAGAVDAVFGHVYFPDEAARRYGLKVSSMVEPSPELEALIARDLERRVGDLPGDGAETFAPKLALGRIGDHLLELAEAERVDLIVCGTHRKEGLARLSSVAAVVLHEARQSVVSVPLTPEAALDHVPPIGVVAVATDRSAFGNRAIPWAYALAGERGEVHLIHVFDEDVDGDDRAICDELRALAPRTRPGVRTVAHVVRGKDPARAIAEAAERIGADVIAIASHGRSGLTRALVGSVADKLIRDSRRPVLVLRPVA